MFNIFLPFNGIIFCGLLPYVVYFITDANIFRYHAILTTIVKGVIAQIKKSRTVNES